METILANVKGRARRETLNGREYLVADAVLIVPGVLNGSQGALYYPPEEVARDPWAWNGMPLVGYHPEENGTHISGRDPDVLNRQGLGHFYRAKANGKLGGEAWFDVELTRTFDAQLAENVRILPRLERGEPIELSTGLFTDNEPAPAGATCNGVPYDFIARNYRPDHVAVLPDQKGACSNADGCGVLVNEKPGWLARLWQHLAAKGIDPAPLLGVTNEEEPDMNRKARIDWLTTNCDCWKGKDDRATLEKFSDDKLAALQANAESAKKLALVTNAAKRLTRNADGEGEAAGVDIAALADFLGVTTDPKTDPVAYVDELKMKLTEVLDKIGGPKTPEPEEPAAEEVVAAAEKDEEEKKMATNRRPVTAQQWLATAPAEIRAAVHNAMEVERRERTRLVEHLVANVADADARKRLAARLMPKPLDELRDLAGLLPTTSHTPVEEPAVSYFGAGGAPAANYRDDTDADDILPSPYSYSA